MSGFGEANFSLWLSQFTRTGSVLVIFGENSPVSVIQNTLSIINFHDFREKTAVSVEITQKIEKF